MRQLDIEYKDNKRLQPLVGEISCMKVFCYDLSLAGLLLESGNTWKTLIHGSTVFDGVDERQVAKALESAAGESQKEGFQHICALNTDAIPYDDFTGSFKDEFERQVVIKFTDAADDGDLLGIRF